MPCSFARCGVENHIYKTGEHRTGQSLLFVDSGPGLSASLAQDMTVALGALNINKLEILTQETGASKAKEVAQIFTDLDGTIGTPDLVVYNPSARVRSPIQDLDP